MSKLRKTLYRLANVTILLQGNSKTKIHYLYILAFLKNLGNRFLFTVKPEKKVARYWTNQSIQEIIFLADKLYKEGKYLEVYEILNKLKFRQYAEIQWRIARVLYKLSVDQKQNISEENKREMTNEAYHILVEAETIGEDMSNYHKWMAIIQNEKYGLDGLEFRVKNYPNVIRHLIKASQLNPSDFTLQYMLGKYSYELSNLNWFQRIAACLIVADPPHSTYQEAYQYLTRAEELQPRTYLPNIFLLGKTCIKLRQFYRAKYYLNLVIHLAGDDKNLRTWANQAKKLIDTLEKYNLGKHIFYFRETFEFNDS